MVFDLTKTHTHFLSFLLAHLLTYHPDMFPVDVCRYVFRVEMFSL